MGEGSSSSRPDQKVPVRLIGVLASAAGRRHLELDLPEGSTIGDLVSILLKEVNSTQFREFLVDSATGDPRPNVIILVNDQDCNVLSGLRTRLGQGTAVTIIPVAHGGKC